MEKSFATLESEFNLNLLSNMILRQHKFWNINTGLPADLENLEKPGISLCHLGNLKNQVKFFENLENIFFDLEFSF